jgi:hypothetical protein
VDFGPLVAPAEVIVPGRRRAPPGLIVRVEDVPPTERWRVQAVAVTSPARTALDLAHCFAFPPHEVIRCATTTPAGAGRRACPKL